MRTTTLFTALAAAALTAFSTAGAQQKRTITFDDFSAVRAVSDPQPSPDGKLVLYSVRTTDVAANTRASQTFVVPMAGGTPHVFPSTEAGATEARWSPDGKRFAYVAHDQLWIADATGANARQLTHLHGGATGPCLGAPRRSHRVHVGRLSAVPDRRVQRGERQSGGGQEGEGSHRRPIDVSALERLE